MEFPRKVGMFAASEEMTKTRRPRRIDSPALEAKVALAAIKGERTLIELAHDFDVRLNQIKQCRDQLLAEAIVMFWEAPRA